MKGGSQLYGKIEGSMNFSLKRMANMKEALLSGEPLKFKFSSPCQGKQTREKQLPPAHLRGIVYLMLSRSSSNYLLVLSGLGTLLDSVSLYPFALWSRCSPNSCLAGDALGFR